MPMRRGMRVWRAVGTCQGSSATPVSEPTIGGCGPLTADLLGEVVLERELQFEPITLIRVLEHLAAAPLQLAAHQHSRNRRVQQVAERVLACPERRGRLSVGV